MKGVRVQFLVGELTPHMLRAQKTQNIKQKQHCNKFTKDFKNGPHKNNLKNIFILKKIKLNSVEMPSF